MTEKIPEDSKTRVCLVIGAGSGIGRAVAIRCAQDGYTVIAAARRMHLLNRVVDEIGPAAHAVHLDVTDHEEVGLRINEIIKTYGRIDVLVYSAGIMTYSLVKNTFFDDWKKMISANCIGLVDVVSTVFTYMLNSNIAGHIVAISSDAGRSPFPGLAVYTGTKFFMEGFLRSLRLEYKTSNIRITSIQPGDVKTDAQQHSTDCEAAGIYSPLHVPPEACTKAWKAMLDTDVVSNAVSFALSQPTGVAVNEILLQPIGNPT